MFYKVLVATAGTGSRLKKLTHHTNKALIPINGRAAIEYVLDNYDVTVPIVVVLGFQANQVREYLTKKHPARNFEFVEVDKYEGQGSSQLYSMLSARKTLQCPFVFHACDTILLETVPVPSENWVGGYVTDLALLDISQYRSHRVKDDYLLTIQDKGASEFDSIHIGIVGVNDYESFWELALSIYKNNPADQTLGDVSVIESMIKREIRFKWVPFKIWLDTGNIGALEKTEHFLQTYINTKDES